MIDGCRQAGCHLSLALFAFFSLRRNHDDVKQDDDVLLLCLYEHTDFSSSPRREGERNERDRARERETGQLHFSSFSSLNVRAGEKHSLVSVHFEITYHSTHCWILSLPLARYFLHTWYQVTANASNLISKARWDHREQKRSAHAPVAFPLARWSSWYMWLQFRSPCSLANDPFIFALIIDQLLEILLDLNTQKKNARPIVLHDFCFAAYVPDRLSNDLSSRYSSR